MLVRMEFVTEEVLVRALSKQTGIARADLTGEGDQRALGVVPADTAEEFCVVAMSDPLNISATDHLVSLTGGKKVETLLAGASAIRNAISRWYRGEEVLRDDGEGAGMNIVNNAGKTEKVGVDAKPAKAAPKAAPAAARARQSAVEVLRAVEDT